MDAITALMERFDRQFPDATEFARGSYEYECRKVLDDLEALGLVPVPDWSRATAPAAG